MNKLKMLLEIANKPIKQKKEDGTAADLGVVPTGHIRDDEESNIISVNDGE